VNLGGGVEEAEGYDPVLGINQGIEGVAKNLLLNMLGQIPGRSTSEANQ
jgi:hypothetical protein